MHKTLRLNDNEEFAGLETIDRIKKKSKTLKSLRAAHVNSTYSGGGVAQLLSSLTILMTNVGIKTEWRVIQGPSDFFRVTKKIHNALQGGEISLTDREMELYEEVIYENSIRIHLNHDIVIIHDPQPLPMINHYRRTGPWIWCCHIDLSCPNHQKNCC